AAFLYAGRRLVRAGHREVRRPGHRHLPHGRHRRDPGDRRAVRQRDPEALAEFRGLPLPPEDGPVEVLRGLLVTTGQAHPAGGAEHMAGGDDVRGRGGMSRIVVHGSASCSRRPASGRSSTSVRPEPLRAPAEYPGGATETEAPVRLSPVARTLPSDRMETCQSYRTSP